VAKVLDQPVARSNARPQRHTARRKRSNAVGSFIAEPPLVGVAIPASSGTTSLTFDTVRVSRRRTRRHRERRISRPRAPTAPVG
jgi:hypothetical protein